MSAKYKRSASNKEKHHQQMLLQQQQQLELQNELASARNLGIKIYNEPRYTTINIFMSSRGD